MNKSRFILAVLAVFLIARPGSIFSQEGTGSFYTESIHEIDDYLKTEDYQEALFTLNDLVNSGKGNENIEYKIGLCYLNLVNGKEKAVLHLQKALSNIAKDYRVDDVNESRAPSKTYLYLGDAYKLCTRLKDAESAYKKYLSLVTGDAYQQLVGQKRILECHITELLMKTPVEATFVKLGNNINQGISNFNPCISGDGKSLVFSRKTKFYDGIFYCTRTDSGWSRPKEIITQLGSDGDFYPCALSYDGKKMLLESFHPGSAKDVYESRLKENGKWEKMKALDKLNSPYEDISPVYSPDGKTIFFSSNRTGGIGGFDLYKIPLGEDGSLGEPENLGNVINTEWDEKFPAFMEDGKTLVFCSDRKPGLGGLDYFYTRKNTQGVWKDVYNVGYPVSTVANDDKLSTLHNANEGLMARYDPASSAEEDIFDAHFTLFSRFKLVPVSGSLSLKNESFLLNNSSLFFIDESIEDTIAKIEKPEGGTYQVELYPGSFDVVLESGDKKMTSKMVVPSEYPGNVFSVVNELKPAETEEKQMAAVNDTIHISDILFAFNISSLSAGESVKIDKLLENIKNYPVTKVELYGFTDNIGPESYNLKLSQKRALSVQQYLVKKGISSRVISAKGMAGLRIVARNVNPDGSDNPEGRRFNRRVEVVIYFSSPSLIVSKDDLVPQDLKP